MLVHWCDMCGELEPSVQVVPGPDGSDVRVCHDCLDKNMCDACDERLASTEDMGESLSWDELGAFSLGCETYKLCEECAR